MGVLSTSNEFSSCHARYCSKPHLAVAGADISGNQLNELHGLRSRTQYRERVQFQRYMVLERGVQQGGRTAFDEIRGRVLGDVEQSAGANFNVWHPGVYERMDSAERAGCECEFRECFRFLSAWLSEQRDRTVQPGNVLLEPLLRRVLPGRLARKWKAISEFGYPVGL